MHGPRKPELTKAKLYSTGAIGPTHGLTQKIIRPPRSRPVRLVPNGKSGIGHKPEKSGKKKVQGKQRKPRGVICTPWQVNPHLLERFKRRQREPKISRIGPPEKRRFVYASPPGEAPWKYLKNVVTTSDDRPKMLVSGPELVLDRRARRAVVVLPEQIACMSGNAMTWKSTKKHEQVGHRVNELVVCRSGRWVYVGSFQGHYASTMEPDRFQKLPQSMKDAVYRLSVGHRDSEDARGEVARRYESGEFHAARVELHYVGFNGAIANGLTGALDHRYRSKARRSRQGCVALC
ncbi:uncharacterized protein FIBRA_06941 [Fibroporia radiculosa]|uniref:Uncharacterized protein n=1 Tax=Fibroporia radiculosa TaxID=599839 RepID=J4IBJ1_9APHY|nr:uncharacterized protein FIBRA_06941 [Fibroporia radiculosa]CCM04751.1 predicted protein [Fibroporia radiculosa]